MSESWPDGNGDEVNNRNFQQRRSHLPPGSSYGVGLLFLFVLLYPLQYTFMLSLEVVDTGDSLSMSLIYHTLLARCQLERVLAGRNDDGGIQL